MAVAATAEAAKTATKAGGGGQRKHKLELAPLSRLQSVLFALASTLDPIISVCAWLAYTQCTREGFFCWVEMPKFSFDSWTANDLVVYEFASEMLDLVSATMALHP